MDKNTGTGEYIDTSNGNDEGSNGDDSGITETIIPAAGDRKRGRGRPRRDAAGGSGESGRNGTGTGTGNGNGNTGGGGSGKKKSLDIKQIATTLQFAHAIAGELVKNIDPVLAEIIPLSDDESEKMAKAFSGLAEFYNFAPNPKTMAWANAFFICGTIYGGKAMVYSAAAENYRRSQEKIIN